MQSSLVGCVVVCADVVLLAEPVFNLRVACWVDQVIRVSFCLVDLSVIEDNGWLGSESVIVSLAEVLGGLDLEIGDLQVLDILSRTVWVMQWLGSKSGLKMH